MCDADDVSVAAFPWKSVVAAPMGVCGPTNVHALPVYPRNWPFIVSHHKSPAVGAADGAVALGTACENTFQAVP